MTDPERDQLAAIALAALDAAGEATVVIAADDAGTHRVIHVNDSMVNLLGIERESLVAAPIDILNSVDSSLEQIMDGQVADSAPIAAVGGASATLDLRPVEAGGRRYWFGTVRAEPSESDQAAPNLLTGRPSSAMFEDRLRRAVTQARRARQEIAVLAVEIDRFDDINRAFGPSVADTILDGIAVRLDLQVRESDSVVRIGDSRFGLVLPVAHGRHAARLAQKIKDALAPPFVIADSRVDVTPSIGISLFPDDASHVDGLVRGALAAMAEAGDDGGNGFRFASLVMDREVRELITREIQIRWALEQDELRLLYQPVVDTGDALAGVEALLRWEHPEQGLLMPSAFLATAVETETIVPIGEWVLETASRQLKAWHDRGLARVPVTVNLSPTELRRPGLVAFIAGLLERIGLDGRYLCLDLPIRAFRDDRELDALIGQLGALKSLGLLLSLDHFGSQDIPLDLLQRLPLDRFSLHRELIGADAADRDRDRIAGAAVALGHSLEFTVLAQGVESAAARSSLRFRNVDVLQGRLVSEPLSAEAFFDRFGTPNDS